jgi:K+-transporting ATPase KdpF subunit
MGAARKPSRIPTRRVASRRAGRERKLRLIGEQKKCSMQSCWLSALRSSCWARATYLPATGSKEKTMLFDYGLAAAVTLGLLAYLVFALIRPERF